MTQGGSNGIVPKENDQFADRLTPMRDGASRCAEPPHDADAERSVLGAMLLHPDAVPEVTGILRPTDFYLPLHQHVARAIVEAHAATGQADPITVADVLRRRGHSEIDVPALLDIMELCVSAVGVGHHAQIVREYAHRRRLLDRARRVQTAAQEGADAATMQELLAAAADQETGLSAVSIRGWRAVADDPPVQWLVDGLLPRAGLVVLAGAPGAGKTLVALDIALRAAHGQDWLGRRIVAHSTLLLAGEGMGGLAPRLRAWRAMHPAAMPAMGQYFAIGAGVPDLAQPTGARELMRLVDEARRAQGRVPDVVIVDTFARAAGAADENAAAAVGGVVAALAALQRERGCTVVVTHHTRKPTIDRGAARTQHDLRGSSALAGAADVVLLATRDGDVRALRVAKSRDGGDGEQIPYSVTVVTTGATREDGRPEFGPVALPAAPRPVAADPAAEAAAEDAVRLAAILDAVDRLAGTPTTRDDLCRAARVRVVDGRALVDLAVAAGQIVAVPSGRRTSYSRGTVPIPHTLHSPQTPRDGGTAAPPAASAVRDGSGTTTGRRDGEHQEGCA